jgi:tRNA A37 threonylcarbamoyladenosine modification protein TsaB
MEKFLVFHTRYKDVQIGYFEQQNLVELYALDSIKVSKCLLATVDNLFQKFDISLKNISFLAAHSGPAPYTTLRVVLATLNGINFSVQTPLVGVNGLDAFLKHLNNANTNIVLLNAFGHDLYYGISDQKISAPIFGCKNFDLLLNEIAHDVQGNINFFGNGATMYKDKIEQVFGSRALIGSKLELPNGYDTEIVPIQFVAQEALKKWHNKEIEQELFPVYLK